MSRAGFLFAQCLLESLLSVSDKLLISIRVDKNTGAILRIALQFGEHVEVAAVGSQKYVAGQSTQHRKGMLEILNDAGVAYGMAGCRDEVVLRAGEIMSAAQIAMIAGLPYTALCDAILAHPTFVEGLHSLFSSPPSAPSERVNEQAAVFAKA
jgi:hypothetical protein